MTKSVLNEENENKMVVMGRGRQMMVVGCAVANADEGGCEEEKVVVVDRWTNKKSAAFLPPCGERELTGIWPSLTLRPGGNGIAAKRCQHLAR